DPRQRLGIPFARGKRTVIVSKSCTTIKTNEEAGAFGAGVEIDGKAHDGGPCGRRRSLITNGQHQHHDRELHECQNDINYYQWHASPSRHPSATLVGDGYRKGEREEGQNAI